MNSNASAALRPAGWSDGLAPNPLLTMREFFRRPQDVGSAFPASRRLVEAVLDTVDLSAARLVVEYGPGSGRFTRALLDRMPDDGHLVAIDTSPRFTRHLQQTIRDRRLHAVSDSAQQAAAILQGLRLKGVDLVVTGIPFSTIDPTVGAEIVSASAGLMNPQGQLIAYQMRDAVEPMLQQSFAQVERTRCWHNLPPCHIFRATGPRSGAS